MKRIVVTGAKGGTGTGIVGELRGRGYDVLGVDRRPHTPADGTGYVQVDLRNATGVNDAFAGADAVIHFGSPPGDFGVSTTEAFHQVAVAGFNVFQAARNVGVERLAWASSIEVYGDLVRHPSLPVTEEGPLAPPGIYGCSKLLLERMAEDYCRWHGMSIAGFRLTRIIYDNEAGRAKLEDLLADEAFGADCIWSYVDARDVATACLAWLESERQGAEVFNLAAANVHHEATVSELLQRHGYADLPIQAGEEPEDPRATLFSTRKIRAMLGWRERYDWRELRGNPDRLA